MTVPLYQVQRLQQIRQEQVMLYIYAGDAETVSKWNSRKLWFCTALAIGLFVIVTKGIISGDVFESCFWAIVLGYTGGNASEHFAQRKTDG